MNESDRLWDLQVLLSALNERERMMAAKPESFAVIDAEYQAANEEMDKIQQQLDSLNRERRRVEGEFSDQQELLKKYQGQLMQVKNQQQYAAAWKEIDAARKHVKELEESLLENMSQIDTLQKQLDERKSGHDALQARYDAAHDEWQQSLGDLRAEAEGLKKKISDLEPSIPPRLLAEFYKVYKQRQQVAVTPVANDSCSSCRSRVRPALAQQLKRGELVRCEGCHRILTLRTAS